MELSAVLQAHCQTIATRWRREIREQDTTAAAFADRLPTLFDGLAHWLDARPADAKPVFEEFAEAHACERHRAHAELAVVFDEYARLRRVIVEVVLEHQDSETAADVLRQIGALEAGLDQVTSMAVTRFELEHNRLRERFIGMLIHDLRDPLTAVMMSANLLADMTLGERQAQLVGRITRGGRRIERMVDEVVDFARGQIGEGLTIAPTAFDLSEICHEAIADHRTQPASRDIVFEPSGNLAGSWDRERLRQAVGNLIIHAAQGSQGPIQMHAREREDHKAVVTSITSRGPSLAPDALTRLFNPLARALLDPARVRGLGLGLYMVERIALAHGGSVRATSSSTDGTTIIAEWPR